MALIRRKKLQRRNKRERLTSKSETSVSSEICNESLEELYEAETRVFETPEMIYLIFKNALDDVEHGNFHDDLPDIDW